MIERTGTDVIGRSPAPFDPQRLPDGVLFA